MSLDDPKVILQIYQTLNGIRPFYEKTEYPYNSMVGRVIETKKEIDLKFSKNKNFFQDSSKPTKAKKKGGGEEEASILILF